MSEPIAGHGRTAPSYNGTTEPPPAMPTTGIAWNTEQNVIDLSGGYKRPDRLYNVATNILLKANGDAQNETGAQPTDSAIAAEVKNLVSIYNAAAKSHGWKEINDANDVTSEQLTNVISAFGADT